MPLKLLLTSFHRFRIGIDDHNQGGPAPLPNLLQLVGKLFTHALLPGSFASRERSAVDLATEPATRKRRTNLCVCESSQKQDHAGAHRSQPRAITSE